MKAISEAIRSEESQRTVDKAGNYAFWLLLTLIGADAIFDFVPEQSASTIYLIVGTGLFWLSLLVFRLANSN